MDSSAAAESAAVAAAMEVLDRHIDALNRNNADALARTLHFSHYRLAGTTMQVWEEPAH